MHYYALVRGRWEEYIGSPYDLYRKEEIFQHCAAISMVYDARRNAAQQ